MTYESEDPETFDDSETLPGEGMSAIDRDEYREEMFRALLRDILSPEDKKRYTALRLIQYFECDPRLAPYLTTLLNDPDTSRMRDGVEGIGEWAHSDGTSLLINFFTDAHHADRIDADMEQQILVALGKIGGPDALQFLQHYTLQRFELHPDGPDDLGMTGVEAVARIATHGHTDAVEFLMKGCAHTHWNCRESCANALGLVFGGRESVPKAVYETLMTLSRDENKHVCIAAFMSLDDIVGLDERNQRRLREARQKQIFGDGA